MRAVKQYLPDDVPGEDVRALRKAALLSLAAVGVLFITGCFFYKERALFSDGAYALFNIVNSNSLAIQESRYGSVITQYFPYIGAKFHLPLWSLIFLYGMSFNLFYLVACIAVYAMKQYRIVILMGLFYFLFVSQSFIWVSEIPQGITWLFLMLATISWLHQKRVNIFISAIPFLCFAFLAVFSHMIIIIPVFFLWIYLGIDGENLPLSMRFFVLLGVMLAALFVAKYEMSVYHSETAYDSAHLDGLHHMTVRSIIRSLRTPVIKMFTYRCLVNYWVGVLVFLTGIASLYKQRKNRLVIWTLLCLLFYVLLMGITYSQYDENVLLFHIESEWVCISIIMIAPFVFSFLPGRNPGRVFCLLAAIFIIRFSYIAAYLPAFTARIRIEEQILSQMRKKNITKLAIYNTKQLQKTFILDWGLSCESLMMSQTDGDLPQRTFMLVNPDDTARVHMVMHAKGMVLPWGVINGEGYNANYFKIDSSRGYQVMSYSDIMQ